MRSERSSPGTIEAPRLNAADKALRLAKTERTEKEGEVLRSALKKRTNGILKDLKLPFEIEEERGKLELEVEVERPLSIKDYEGFDLQDLMADPNFRTETRRIGSLEYVVTERVRSESGQESETVRPDAHGQYPSEEDLQAAMAHDFFSAQRWFQQDRIFPEDAALIVHNFHPRPSEWLWQAMDALLAANPNMEPEQAAKWAGTVIKELIAAHRKRAESL